MALIPEISNGGVVFKFPCILLQVKMAHGPFSHLDLPSAEKPERFVLVLEPS
jgi:hypothetical protein